LSEASSKAVRLGIASVVIANSQDISLHLPWRTAGSPQTRTAWSIAPGRRVC